MPDADAKSHIDSLTDTESDGGSGGAVGSVLRDRKQKHFWPRFNPSRLPRDPEAGGLRCIGETTGPGRGSGTPKRTIHMLRKPANPLASDRSGTVP